MDINLLDQFVDAIKTDNTEKTDTHSAIVSKIDDEGTVWVYVAGSDKETPTEGTSAEVKKGDAVNVQWRNNKLYIGGNYSNPSAGVGRVAQVEMAAEVASQAAGQAVADAGRARTAAEDATASAAEAKSIAEGVESIAESAQTAADTAFTNLAQVQSVLEVAQWIATHGTYLKATSYSADATYYTITASQVAEPSEEDKDSQGVLIYYELSSGIYTRTTDTDIDETKIYYRVSGTPVAQSKAEDIGQYYTLAVSEAMADFVQSHLALTDDGLYIMNDGSKWKVKIANDGVYILDPDNRPVNRMVADKNIIGYNDETHTVIGKYFLELYDKNSKPYFTVIDEGWSRDYLDISEYYDVFIKDEDYTLYTRYSVHEVVSIHAKSSRAETDITDYTLDGSSITIPKEQLAPHIGTLPGLYNINFDITYTTDSSKFKTLKFIDKDPRIANRRGAYSIEVGSFNYTLGDYSFTGGKGSHTNGSQSLTFGSYLGNRYDDQLTIGRYNRFSFDGPFMIGNGVDNNNRSNCFTVDWDGNVVASGDIKATRNLQGQNSLLELDTTAASGTDYEIYSALQSLGWTDCIV